MPRKIPIHVAGANVALRRHTGRGPEAEDRERSGGADAAAIARRRQPVVLRGVRRHGSVGLLREASAGSAKGSRLAGVVRGRPAAGPRVPTLVRFGYD